MKEKQKKEAIARMKMLKMLENPIEDFKEGVLNLSENGGFLYWLNEEEKKIVEEFENRESKPLVYHVIKSFTSMGIMYSLLFVSGYEEEWEDDRADIKGGSAIAYVYNSLMPDCSEMGSIGIKPCIGGVARTW